MADREFNITRTANRATAAVSLHPTNDVLGLAPSRRLLKCLPHDVTMKSSRNNVQRHLQWPHA